MLWLMLAHWTRSDRSLVVSTVEPMAKLIERSTGAKPRAHWVVPVPLPRLQLAPALPKVLRVFVFPPPLAPANPSLDSARAVATSDVACPLLLVRRALPTVDRVFAVINQHALLAHPTLVFVQVRRIFNAVCKINLIE